MSFAKPLFVVLSAVAWPLVGLADQPQGGNSSRLATFQDAGNYYFALSLQADPAGDYPLASAYEVVVLVDTSATQTGPVRIESLDVAQELARSLPAGASVALLACVVFVFGYWAISARKWFTGPQHTIDTAVVEAFED